MDAGVGMIHQELKLLPQLSIAENVFVGRYLMKGGRIDRKAMEDRAQAGLKPIDWLVVRNRLGAQQMHNKKKVGAALEELSRRIGFRVAAGFSERVIFRELFPRGLTLLDLKDVGVESLNISNVAARQELRDLMRELALPGVEVNF